jgi:pseudouridine-5'-phosphate glycosidase
MNLSPYLSVSEEVAAAIAANQPVVALESTIISHGMPYPKNVATALQVEQLVRENGAIPATIAIIQGKLTAGISKDEIEYLGQRGQNVAKASRRDLPLLLSRGQDGATTVATTMIAATLAGIRVFATGGVGGVHRGGEKTMDISADLEELAMTDVMVVCAGCKSILDIGLTLEYLETKGVPVIGFGTDDFPAFYTTRSGFKVEARLDRPEDVAAAFMAKMACGLRGGMLIGNPIPEQDAMDPDYIRSSIESALHEAEILGITGKKVTPFLLDKIQQITGGKSLEANIKLVCNNAILGARIAQAWSRLE